MRKALMVCLVVLLVAAVDATQRTRTRHHQTRRHRHLHKLPQSSAAVAVPPFFSAPGFMPPTPPGITALGSPEAMAVTPNLMDPTSAPGMFPQFAEVETTTTTTSKPEENKDLVTSIYNLLSKNRDITVEDNSKLQKMKEENQKLKDKLERRGQALAERSEMLRRLEFCLMDNGKQPKNNTAVQAKDAEAGNKKVIAAALTNATDELVKRQKALDERQKALDAQEQKLQDMIKQLRREEMEFAKRVAALNEQKQLAEINATKCEHKPPVIETKYVKVPEVVYKAVPTGCEAITDCGTCAADSNCGWCDGTARCIEARNGTTAECDATSWSYNFCKMHKCVQHVNCRSCMADPRCGMCATTGTCMEGSLTGPTAGACNEWNYATDLRFMSYNIYGRDIRNTSGRTPWLFKMLKEGNPDFIALQEVEDWFIEELAKDRWALDYHLSDFGSGHAPGGLLIMSRVPLESVSYYEKTDPGQIEVDQRARLLVVKPKLGSRNLALATTTLDWRNANNRAASLDYVFSVLNTTSDVVLMGDMNFDAAAEPESSHIPSSYTDLWPRLHPDQRGYTWDPEHNAYAKESDPTSLPSRIDRTLVHSGWWQPSKIDKIGCPEASPHYGLLSEFSLFGAYC